MQDVQVVGDERAQAGERGALVGDAGLGPAACRRQLGRGDAVQVVQQVVQLAGAAAQLDKDQVVHQSRRFVGPPGLQQVVHNVAQGADVDQARAVVVRLTKPKRGPGKLSVGTSQA